MPPLSKWIDTLPYCRRVTDAARVSLEARLASVSYWLPLAARQLDDDVEKVHQLRVATRRALAALKLYHGWLPRSDSKWLSRRLKRIRRTAGEARDLDVLAQWIRESTPGEATGLLSMIAQHRAAAQPKIIADAAHCERANRFPRHVFALLAGIRPRSRKTKKQDLSFRNWAEIQLARTTESFFAAVPSHGNDLSALHQFRIRGKRLRYTVELLAAAIGPDLRKVHYPVVEELQEKLGRINDCATADERLRRWRRKSKTVDELDLLDRLIDHKRSVLDQALADYRTWWTTDRTESLRLALASLIGGDAEDPTTQQCDADKSAVVQP